MAVMGFKNSLKERRTVERVDKLEKLPYWPERNTKRTGGGARGAKRNRGIYGNAEISKSDSYPKVLLSKRQLSKNTVVEKHYCQKEQYERLMNCTNCHYPTIAGRVSQKIYSFRFVPWKDISKTTHRVRRFVFSFFVDGDAATDANGSLFNLPSLSLSLTIQTQLSSASV